MEIFTDTWFYIESLDHRMTEAIHTFLAGYMTTGYTPTLSLLLPLFIKIFLYDTAFLIISGIIFMARGEESRFRVVFYTFLGIFFVSLLLTFYGFLLLFFAK